MRGDFLLRYKIITDHIDILSNSNFGEWSSVNSSEDVVTLPFVIYSKEVMDFLLSVDNFLDIENNDIFFDYKALLERENIEYSMDTFIDADINTLQAETLCAMIIGTIRANRFCEGVLLEAFEHGHILKWLKRIKDLDEAKELIDEIDATIRYVWKNKIKDDYNNGWLLKEDTLKNSFYFHLRSKLGDLFDKHDIRIFTEFTDEKFKGTGYRPDMVIATVNFDSDDSYYGNSITNCLAVIEFKYKQGFNSSTDIYEDYKKLRKYASNLKINCKLYMATIWEYEDDETCWESENSRWATGKLTELNASYKRNSNEMNFYICDH